MDRGHAAAGQYRAEAVAAVEQRKAESISGARPATAVTSDPGRSSMRRRYRPSGCSRCTPVLWMVSAVSDLSRELGTFGTPGGWTSSPATTRGAGRGERRRERSGRALRRRRGAPGSRGRAAAGSPVSRVHQMVRDGHLLSVRRDGAVWVPSDFFSRHAPVKGLSGTIMLLRDGGSRRGHPAVAVRRRPLAARQPDRGAACRAAPRGQAARAGHGVLTGVLTGALDRQARAATARPRPGRRRPRAGGSGP